MNTIAPFGVRDTSLHCAIGSYYNSFVPPEEREILSAEQWGKNLVVIDRTNLYRKHFRVTSDNSFLKERAAPLRRFGWMSNYGDKKLYETLEWQFEEPDVFKGIVKAWERNLFDPVIFINKLLCEGSHRAVLAWHFGLKYYPIIFLGTPDQRNSDGETIL